VQHCHSSSNSIVFNSRRRECHRALYQFSGTVSPIFLAERFSERLASARAEARLPPRVPLMIPDGSGSGDGHEGRTRSRGASRVSRECRLKQRWCSGTETGLSLSRRGERERRVPTRAAREFFLSITKRNSPAHSPSSVLIARFHHAGVPSLFPDDRVYAHSVTSAFFSLAIYENSRLVDRSVSTAIAFRGSDFAETSAN